MHVGQRVFVYRNLTRKCYSIRAMDGPQKGVVVGHANFIQLENCEFKVSEAGRQRVIRERRKNVHAGVIGDIVFGSNWDVVTGQAYPHIELEAPSKAFLTQPIPILYNPYVYRKFQISGGVEVNRAELCILHLTGILATQLS